MSEIFLSIVIPLYNEEKRLINLPEKLKPFLRDLNRTSEIVLIDDGSTDNTYRTARNLNGEIANLKLLRHEKNLGKGAAVKTGMLNAVGKLRLMTDVDFSTPLSEFYKLWKILDRTRADIAIGSRALVRSEIIKHQPFWRESLGKAFNRLVQLMLIPGIHDSQCGFKLFKGDAAERIFGVVRINRWSFDVEVLYLARKLAYKIVEVPVVWANNHDTRVSPVRESWQTLRDLIKIRMTDYNLDSYNLKKSYFKLLS